MSLVPMVWFQLSCNGCYQRHNDWVCLSDFYQTRYSSLLRSSWTKSYIITVPLACAFGAEKESWEMIHGVINQNSSDRGSIELQCIFRKDTLQRPRVKTREIGRNFWVTIRRSMDNVLHCNIITKGFLAPSASIVSWFTVWDDAI